MVRTIRIEFGGPSTSLRYAQDERIFGCFLKLNLGADDPRLWVRLTDGPSTSLRYAQDERIPGCFLRSAAIVRANVLHAGASILSARFCLPVVPVFGSAHGLHWLSRSPLARSPAAP